LSHDPLSERVHHTRGELPALLFRSLREFASARLRPKKTLTDSAASP
jgi:phosphopentomutase